jgi:hypothetical protein
MEADVRRRRFWRLAAGLVLVAALAQACGGGSSKSTGATGGRLELRFSQAKGARLGLLPQGCQSVDITVQPDNRTFTGTDTTVSLLLPAGPHSASGVLHCGGQDFPSDKPDAVFTVPPGLQSIDVALVFGGVNVTLTVQVSGGIRVSGTGISCPGDCSESFLTGTSVKLTANQPDAVFSGGCTGTGSCTVLMNADKTVVVAVGNGAIRVTNTGNDSPALRIAIDGATVASNLGLGASVSTTVSSGGHSVQAFCRGEGEFPHPDSPQNVTVSGGATVQVNFDGDRCFLQFLRPRH